MPKQNTWERSPSCDAMRGGMVPPAGRGPLCYELAHLRAKPKYFLSYRDAAKIFDGMTHQQEAKIAQQQKQIDTLAAGLQKVSAQLELSKTATQTVLNNH